MLQRLKGKQARTALQQKNNAGFNRRLGEMTTPGRDNEEQVKETQIARTTRRLRTKHTNPDNISPRDYLLVG